MKEGKKRIPNLLTIINCGSFLSVRERQLICRKDMAVKKKEKKKWNRLKQQKLFGWVECTLWLMDMNLKGFFFFLSPLALLLLFI